MQEIIISGLEHIENAFKEGRFLTLEEIQNYITHNAKANNLLNSNIKVSTSSDISNTVGSYWDRKIELKLNQIIRNDLALDEKNRFKKDTLPEKILKALNKFCSQFKKIEHYIEKQNLSKKNINQCNIAILRIANHELHHAILYDDIDRINKGDMNIHCDLHTMASMIKSTVVKKYSNSAYEKRHDLFYSEYMATNFGNKWTYQLVDQIKENGIKIDKQTCERFSSLEYLELANIYIILGQTSIPKFVSELYGKKIKVDLNFEQNITTLEGYTNYMYYYLPTTKKKKNNLEIALRKVQTEILINDINDPRNEMNQSNKLFYGRLETERRATGIFNRSNSADIDIFQAIFRGEPSFDAIRKYIDEAKPVPSYESKYNGPLSAPTKLPNHKLEKVKPKVKYKTKTTPRKKVQAAS